VAFLFGLTFVLTQQAIEQLRSRRSWRIASSRRPCSSD
jgi:hypothetical protein